MDNWSKQREDQPKEKTCPKCGGRGEIDNGLNIIWLVCLSMPMTDWITCPECKGRGKVKDE